VPWSGRTVTSRDDVQRAIAELTRHDRAGTSALAHAVQTGAEAELTPDRSRLLPVLPELRDVLPWPGGLLKGSTVATVGSTSILLTLLAGGMTEGSYAAVVGMPWLGALAALEDYQIPGERLALIPDPGPDWPTVVAALIDGVDLLVVCAEGAEGTIRSLQARSREKGCVLVPTMRWPGADLVIERTATNWMGLGQGRGRLRRQHATFRVSGRGRAARPKTFEMTFPPPSIRGEEPVQLVPVVDLAARRVPLEPQDQTPENRKPARGEENPLWANIVPNEPPVGLRGGMW
jgi:hypothetical protein